MLHNSMPTNFRDKRKISIIPGCYKRRKFNCKQLINASEYLQLQKIQNLTELEAERKGVANECTMVLLSRLPRSYEQLPSTSSKLKPTLWITKINISKVCYHTHTKNICLLIYRYNLNKMFNRITLREKPILKVIPQK